MSVMSSDRSRETVSCDGCLTAAVSFVMADSDLNFSLLSSWWMVRLKPTSAFSFLTAVRVFSGPSALRSDVVHWRYVTSMCTMWYAVYSALVDTKCTANCNGWMARVKCGTVEQKVSIDTEVISAGCAAYVTRVTTRRANF